ncbi:hypothetical protein CHS0354_016142 [Potamilus streckersoni]|uniref:Delta-like protein n=1 Tax=Potamilus streckersoni TaxID=2493646 RepID=A0AAE0T135_9BIVA|nr:hypothetical protein CHS0354_016142 [Potamilus streckersoni]
MIVQNNFVHFVMILLQFSVVYCGGKVSVRFIRFDNPRGEGNNGHCCDGRAIFCVGSCDHVFTICLDNSYGPNSVDYCPYGRMNSGEIAEADTIVFYDRVGRLLNPLEFHFDTWPFSMKLKVHIVDYDDNDNDFVDFITNLIEMTPAPSVELARPSRLVLKRRVRLDVDVRVYCDPDFYGPRCDVYCKSSDNSLGHYTCSLDGAKLCMNGWVGSNCDRNHDDCAGHACQHGATCLDRHLGYECLCPSGFSGDKCEEEIDECVLLPCANGATCIDRVGHFECHCLNGWFGRLCQNYSACYSDPCQNGGTCLNEGESYLCICPEGWTGSQCMEDVLECSSNPCQFNGTCVEGFNSFQCICPDGLHGSYCETNVDECANTTCLHNSTCVDLINDFECICVNGTTGKNCETVIDQYESHLFNFIIPRKIDEAFSGRLQNILVDVLVDHGLADPKEIMMRTALENIIRKHGDTETNVTVAVCIRGTELSSEELKSVLTPERLDVLNKLFHDNLKTKDARSDQLTAESTEKEHWITSYWYVAVILAVVLVIIVFIPIAVCRQRRRKNMEIRNAETMASYWVHPRNESEIMTFGFENVTYMDYQPDRLPTVQPN